MPEEQQRWYAIKIFERDDKVLAKLHIPEDVHQHIEADIKAAEEELDDDAESIITNERYVYIAEVIRACYRKKSKATQSTSDKIDRIVTNRWLGLPIFAVVMFLVYWVAMVAVGAPATDWANDGVFGDGWHLLGIGSSAYNDANDEYTAATEAVDAFLGLDTEAEDFDADATLAEMKAFQPTSDTATTMVEDEETLAENEMTAYYDNIPDDADEDSTVSMTYVDAVAYLEANGFDAPDPADYGVWVPGIPVLIGNGLEKAGCADWLQGLILDGIVAGVGAVLGFVPQMLILFFFLAILEDCGYMARVSMVLDPIFKKVGLSGKSVISFVIGTGCAIPGVMAARTIRNERERRVTAMLTSFMPCGAKLPVIALFAGAFFADASWVGTLMYFVGIILIFVGALLINKIAGHKVRKSFFIMELPEYKIPSLKRAFYSMCSRGKAYIVKAGTVILVCNTVVQIMQSFTWQLQLVEEGMEHTSILASIASPFAVLLIPLGFGAWQLAAAAITGFIAKENVVGTLAVCYGVTNFIDTEELALVGGGNQVATIMGLTKVAALAYLMFNLYTPPCFAAMGAMNSEIKSKKWLFGGIGLQFATGFTIAFFVYQIGTLITTGSLGNGFIPGLIVVILIAAFIAHLIVKANKSIAKEYALGNNMSNSAKSA